jgi:hypothetical protein
MEPVSSPRGSLRRKAPRILSGVMGWMLLRSPATLRRRRALCRAARPKGAPFGPGKGAVIGSIGEICGRAAVGLGGPAAPFTNKIERRAFRRMRRFESFRLTTRPKNSPAARSALKRELGGSRLDFSFIFEEVRRFVARMHLADETTGLTCYPRSFSALEIKGRKFFRV